MESATHLFEQEHHLITTISISIVVILVILLCIIFSVSVFYFRRYRKIQAFLSKTEVKEFFLGKPRNINNLENRLESTPGDEEADAIKFSGKYKLSANQISIGIR
ncbi:unnamed protein product [Orchesella dallaii]|uniref:Uncharacterized protein n=1 Tax=Orchesella dallaii TaxID=48710 RepID=A0ABP1RVV8_9HEXA